MNIYDFTLNKIDGTPLNLADYRGKTILLVNTASKCGFTPQYAELQKIWEHYQGQGLVVLGVPSNDFAHQEPGSANDIVCFTRDHYKVTFPLTEKVSVTGKNAHPLYLWIAKKVGFIGKPYWNFYKYIINGNGEIVGWFSSLTKPNSPRLIKLLEHTLF